MCYFILKSVRCKILIVIHKENAEVKHWTEFSLWENLYTMASTTLLFETENHSLASVSDVDVTSSETVFNEDSLSTKTRIFVLVMEYVGSVEYLICFIANIITITAVIKFDYLNRKSTNILILSLSVADSLLGKRNYFIQ